MITRERGIRDTVLWLLAFPMAAALKLIRIARRTRARLSRWAGLRLRKGFRDRPDGQRFYYIYAKKVFAWRSTLRRRVLAGRMARQATFEIPRASGFRMFGPDAFPETQDVAADTLRLVQDIGEPSIVRAGYGKDFMVPFLEPRTLTLDSPILKFALREDVISGVTAYLGEIPLLATVNAYYSRVSNLHDYFWSSQLLHCDGDDLSQIKVFVLCNEVTQSHGPLTIMGADTSRRLRRKIGYRYNLRVQDEEASRLVGDDDLHAVIGTPGTTCFVDTTRCFHFGSRIDDDDNPRVVVVLQYLHRVSFSPSEITAPLRHLAGRQTPELIRLVLGAE